MWESTLGLEVWPVSRPGLSKQEACTVMGKVQITGVWQGTVLLECSKKLAETAARIMFGLDGGQPTPEDTRDALAEITNVTAGNFKSMVGGQCQMSMPQVTDRVPGPPVEPQSAVICRQAFDCEGELFLVTVLEG
jgi:chemotaxis protein CheX